ncbi:transposase [Bacteroides heparinolyticus]|uniref:transposase n=1 Tax=Prevotella heparinolytica TaxID=28113 RepID=UPI00359F6E59
MSLLVYEGKSGKMILPILRPGQRNKSLSVHDILKRIIERIHKVWPRCVIELRGDSNFCSHEFMDWVEDECCFIEFVTGITANSVLYGHIDKHLRRCRNRYKKDHSDVRMYYSFEYRAGTWQHSQRIIAKNEINALREHARFIVTSNCNNKPETIYTSCGEWSCG